MSDAAKVLPFPTVEKPPEGSAKHTRITVDEKGRTTIELGVAPEQQKRTRKRPSASNFHHNLALDMDDAALSALAHSLLERIEDDESNRQEWTETVDRTAAFLGIKLEDPVNEVTADGTICQAVATCMLETAIKLWGTAYGELLPVGGPVKVQREEAPPPEDTAGGSGGGIAVPTPDASGAGGIAPPVAANENPASGDGIAGAGGAPGAPSPVEEGQEPVTNADKKGENLAEALEQDMNWYLTKGDPGYYPDFSAMIMNRALVGIAFREQYVCPLERKPISRFHLAQDVIVSGNPSHLGSARRVTLRKKTSQADVRRMMANGHFRNVSLVRPTGRTSVTEIRIGEATGINPQPTLPSDFDHELLQCHCDLGSGTAADLFGDLEMLDVDDRGKVPGFPLPYRVTIDYDSRTILEIRRDWKRGDPDYRRRRRLVKYGFIPAFGGKFYDYGLIHLVGNPTHAATMLQRSCVDSGLLSNFPAWAIAQSAASKLETTTMRPGPGEVVKIPVPAGAELKKSFMPWPYKEPSAQSMALIEKFESDVKAIGGVITLPIGEGRIGTTPVGTIMAYIESVSMVPGAVHKADHIAQAEEFENLRELLAEHPDCLTRGNKSPARKWQIAEELLEPDLMPKADPNTPSQYHRLFKVQASVQLAGLPQFNMPEQIPNQRALFRKSMEVIWGSDAQEFENPPQPTPPAPPDPKMAAAILKAQTEQQQIQGKQQEIQLQHQGKMAEIAADSADKQADRESDERREAMKLAGQHVKTGADLVTAGAEQAADAHAQATEHAHQKQQGAVQQQHEQQMQGAEHENAALTQPPEGEGTP